LDVNAAINGEDFVDEQVLVTSAEIDGNGFSGVERTFGSDAPFVAFSKPCIGIEREHVEGCRSTERSNPETGVVKDNGSASFDGIELGGDCRIEVDGIDCQIVVEVADQDGNFGADAGVGVLDSEKRSAVIFEVFETGDDGEAFSNQRLDGDDMATLCHAIRQLGFVEIPIEELVRVATIGAVKHFGVQDLVLLTSRKN